jgi:hypothetical protein
MIADSGTWMVLTAGISLAAAVYLIGYALFKRAHREDEYMDQRYLEALWLLDQNSEERAAPVSEQDVEGGPGRVVQKARGIGAQRPPLHLFDQDEPLTVPTTWPVICRKCEAPLRLEEAIPGLWFWKHRSAYLDLQHRPDAVPAVTP